MANLKVKFTQGLMPLLLDMAAQLDLWVGYCNLAAWAFLSYAFHFGAFHLDFIKVHHLTFTIHSSRLNYCYSQPHLLRLLSLS